MNKIILTFVLLICSSSIFAQTMVVKKIGGTYEGIPIDNTVEITFYDFPPCTNSEPTILYGGITYHTVQIGAQCWLKENLNVGIKITGVTEQTNNSTIEKYCYGDLDANCTLYGGLYQWAEAVQYQNGATNTTSPSPAFSGNVQGICPTGWHIPTQAEFQSLQSTVSNDGNALKSIGQGIAPGAGTNTSGFSALLAGRRVDSGTFQNINFDAYYCSSTEYNLDYTLEYIMILDRSLNSISVSSLDTKVRGHSVRCVKD